MDPRLIQAISKQVYRRFPEVEGKKPRVRKQRPPQASNGKAEPTYLLTYRGQASGPGGQSIPRWVRVVATPGGKVIKITTSRG